LERAAEAEFARGALGQEAIGELKRGPGLGGDCRDRGKSAKGKEARGLVEAQAHAELTGGGPDDPAAGGGVEGPDTGELDRDGGFAGDGGDGSAATAGGQAGEEELREEVVELGLPTGFFFAGKLSEVGEGLVERGVLLAKDWEDGVADAVAGEGLVGVGGVFAPGLVEGFEEGFDLGAAGLEEGAQDLASGHGDDGVDGGESFGPGTAKEFEEDSLGLVVEGVGGEDGVGVARGDESAEEIVADGAGGLFDGFAGGRDAGKDVGLVEVEGDVVSNAEVFDEALVCEGLFAAEVVVNVNGGEADAEGVVFGLIRGLEGQEQSYGVSSAGDGDADAVAGADVGAVEGKWESCRHAALSYRAECL
jgi:hypothetical protein